MAANKKSNTVVSKKLANYTLDNPSKITFEFLKSHLWSAADILRGSLDASEYRQPVMTLLFLKRLNDTFEENSEKLIKKGMNKKEAYSKRRHYFYIPENARWSVISSAAENIGEKIDDICRIIERENPEIKSPTNAVDIGGRIFVNGTADVPNVNAIQAKLILTPLSVFGRNTTSPQTVTPETNASKQVPIGPQPALIPTTGIKIYDEISKDMADNPPPATDSKVLANFATIGIGPGLTPSDTKNDTIRAALENGIAEGEKLINEKVQYLGMNVNGWLVNLDLGDFGTDYLLRAATVIYGIGANSPEEAVYPGTVTDNEGQNLTGTHNYLIHFDKGQTPPVNAFWSITMYNNKSYLVENPINRYSIGQHTEGLKYNPDGSLDIFIQNASPGADKESNWLPSPSEEFKLVLREYNPQEPILKGEYQIPPVQLVN